jgi:hypothetical protein
MSNSSTTAERAAIRCMTCGIAWSAHTDDCSRHAYRPGLTLAEAAHTLYVHFSCGSASHWIWSIGARQVGPHNDTASLVVMLVRKPYHFEGTIPETWQGYPVESKVIGEVRIGSSDEA